MGGFVQQLAVSYVRHGYRFWVSGTVPAGKDPRRTDVKLVEKYECFWSSSERARHKQRGEANSQYLRHRDFWVLLVTEGEHLFFKPVEEGGESRREGGSGQETRIRDIRRQPIRFAGYSISFRKGTVHVRIAREDYLRLRAWLEDLALKRSAADLADIFQALPFEPYAPVAAQYFALWRRVNRVRAVAGRGPVPYEAVRWKRRIYRPFEVAAHALASLEAA